MYGDTGTRPKKLVPVYGDMGMGPKKLVPVYGDMGVRPKKLVPVYDMGMRPKEQEIRNNAYTPTHTT